MGRSVRRALRSVERVGRKLIPVATAVVGGMIGGPSGATIGYQVGSSASGEDLLGINSSSSTSSSTTTETPVTTTEVNQAITPEGSVTGKGQADLSDTGLGDVVSVFDMFSDQEDEMDILLGRKYNK